MLLLPQLPRPLAGIAATVPTCCKAFARGEHCHGQLTGKCAWAHEVPSEVPVDKTTEYKAWVARKPFVER